MSLVKGFIEKILPDGRIFVRVLVLVRQIRGCQEEESSVRFAASSFEKGAFWARHMG